MKVNTGSILHKFCVGVYTLRWLLPFQLYIGYYLPLHEHFPILISVDLCPVDNDYAMFQTKPASTKCVTSASIK